MDRDMPDAFDPALLQRGKIPKSRYLSHDFLEREARSLWP